MSNKKPQGSLFHPRHWPSWLALGWLRALMILPYPALMAVGRWLGRLAMRFAKRRRRITEINIGLCFPELSSEERATLVRQNFESVGMGVMDMAIGWWWPDRRYQPLMDLEGEEHLKQAFSKGKGVLFVVAHFTSLEISGRVLGERVSIRPIYRPNENPVFEWALLRFRERYIDRIIPREDVRLMLRSLKNGHGIWLAPDQNFGHKGSVFANFFGIPAATNTAASRFAQLSGAPVIPYVVFRKPKGGFRAIIEPPLDNFPSEDIEKDTQRLNDIFERWARMAPEQYIWMHRRFKDRPDGEAPFY